MPVAIPAIPDLDTSNVKSVLGRLADRITSESNPLVRDNMLIVLDDTIEKMHLIGWFGENGEHDPRREPPAPAEQPGPFGDDATSWYAASDSPPHGILNTPSPLMDVRLEDGRFFRACWLPRIGWDSASEFYGSKVTHYRQA